VYPNENLPKSEVITKLSVICIIFLIFTVNIIRFLGIEGSPPGFTIDEAASAVTIQCLAEEGTDAQGKIYPLFGHWDFGTPKPPTHLYFGLLWSKMFGYSIASFRSISAFVTLFTIMGLFFLSQHLFDRCCAWLVTLAATLSPWAFQFSRLALENAMAPCFMVWGTYFFLHKNKWYNFVLAGVFMSLTLYSYPPARVQIPLSFLPLLYLKYRRDGLDIKMLFVFLITLLTVSFPLIQMILSGELLNRFGRISMFSESYLQAMGKTNELGDLISVFIRNYLFHFDPTFLFFTGDRMTLFSSQFVGHFSWLDSFALVLGAICLSSFLYKKIRGKGQALKEDSAFVTFVLANIALGFIPSALTMLESAHASRALGVWPFVSMLTGFILWKVVNNMKFILPFASVLAIVFAILFFKNYFMEYPRISFWMFSAHIKKEALAAKTQSDWHAFIVRYGRSEPHVRYYLMNYNENETCSSTRVGFTQLKK